MSIVCGTSACNAKCPYCVSKTTPSGDLPTHNINFRNLSIACRLAEKSGATTCLITGKGEPTLYPELISTYLQHIREYFPIIELQTNGINIVKPEMADKLKTWHDLGLTTISVSAVHYQPERNQKIYSKDYPNLVEVADVLHKYGFTMRLSVIMLRDYVDTPQIVVKVINFCKSASIKQLTLRPIASPENSSNPTVDWISNHTLLDKGQCIAAFLNSNASPILHLAHGGIVYDYDGQNVCLTDCLTTNETDDNIRQIIFFPDGTISYDWKYKGANLI